MYANLVDPPTTLALTNLARLVVASFHRQLPLKLITYNFDDLLENAIAAADPSIQVHPVSSAVQARASHDGIRVFHPHGYLPRGNPPSANSSVVFSEDEFHVLMSDNAHWANVLQLEVFQNSTCLFVGTSLSDPNVRRLLDRTKHAASSPHWLTRTTPSSISDSRWICRLLSEEMGSLGVRILALDSYEHLPDLFERLTSI
jgi:hypothetical protein